MKDNQQLPFKHRISIFCIEDSELWSLMLDQRLKQISDFRIYTYSSAEAAMKDLYLNPDLILLDYYLPGMNGLEALKKLKSYNPDTPVVVLSSQENIDITLDLIKEGASAYYTKSRFSPQQLYNDICKIHFAKEKQKKKSPPPKKFWLALILLILISIVIYYY